MIKDFILPDIGEGIVECEIVEWLVNEGDQIVEDQAVVEVMTDKAVVEIPAMDTGKIVKLYHQQGDIAKVHAPLFAIETDADAKPEILVTSDEAALASTINIFPEKPVSQPSQPPVSRKVLATPAVRRLGREWNIDLTQIKGSGKNGRILKEDLAQFQPAKESLPPVPPIAESRVEPLKGIKLIMAKRMAEAAATIPHFTYGDEMDLTLLIKLRKDLKSMPGLSDVSLTMMPFFIKALSSAIAEFPIMHSQLNAEITEIIYPSSCNIGMAVDTTQGLVVPNIKNTQNLTILEIAKEVERLTNAAREGKLEQQELQGGTITISNIGALGGTFTSPIINKPEVAVVALGKIQQLPRYNSNGDLVPKQIMQISWSADHRIIDGGIIARFCNLWKRYLENPSLLLIHLR